MEEEKVQEENGAGPVVETGANTQENSVETADATQASPPAQPNPEIEEVKQDDPPTPAEPEVEQAPQVQQESSKPPVNSRSEKQVRLDEVERHHKQLGWIDSILAHLTRRRTDIEANASDEPCYEKDAVEHELDLLEQRGEGMHAVQSYVDQRRKEL